MESAEHGGVTEASLSVPEGLFDDRYRYILWQYHLQTTDPFYHYYDPRTANQNNPQTMATRQPPPPNRIFDLFNETFSLSRMMTEHFPTQLLNDFTFVYLDDQQPPVENRVTLTSMVPDNVNFSNGTISEFYYYCDVLLVLPTGIIPDTRNGSRSYRRLVTHVGDPTLCIDNDSVIPGPVNDSVEIDWNGTKAFWPRWLVEMGAPHTSEATPRENSVYVTLEDGTWRELAYLDPSGEALEIYSPLAWMVTPSDMMNDFASRWEEMRANRRLRELFRNAHSGNVENIRADIARISQTLTQQQTALSLATRGVDQHIETMFKELEQTFAEDPQVAAVWIDNQAEVHAIVGPIVTQDAIDYGFFELAVNSRKAYPITKIFSTYMHANIHTGRNDFCMGETGNEDYSRMVGQGKFSGAIAYFIYRLSHPGGNGYRPHNSTFVPQPFPDAADRMIRRLTFDTYVLWHRERGADEIRGMFREEHAAMAKASGRARAKPYLHDLVPLDIVEVFWRMDNAGYERDDLTQEETCAAAFDYHLLDDIVRVYDEETVWERPRNTYVVRRGTRTATEVAEVAEEESVDIAGHIQALVNQAGATMAERAGETVVSRTLSSHRTDFNAEYEFNPYPNPIFNIRTRDQVNPTFNHGPREETRTRTNQ